MHFLVIAALAAPLSCLGLLFWLAHLEDTLVRDVRKSAHGHDPEPILSIAVPVPQRAVQLAPSLHAVPEQETVAVMSLGGRSAADADAVPVAKPA